jgi:hypothetical protein
MAEITETMIDRVAEAIEAKLDDYRWAGDAELVGEGRQNMAREIARAAIEAMREPTEGQLDAVRRIVQWHNFDRPTEASLIRHCKALGKEPPAECRDVEHVPPTNMTSYWIYSGMIDAALKEHEGKPE